MQPRVNQSTSFSVHRAFVVQFRAETIPERDHWTGRSEHVVSGQATHFDTLADLLAFFERVLAQVPPSREP